MFISIHCSRRLRSVGPTVLTLLALTLTKTPTLSAAIPRVYIGSTMLAADRADLALNAGLWRGEFLSTREEEASSAPGASDDENHQSQQALRATDVHLNTNIVNLEGAVEEYFQDGATIHADSTGSEIMVTEETSEHLSDWEQAICDVSDGKNFQAGQKGPSMITAIIAIVGVIVVIGAYMKK